MFRNALTGRHVSHETQIWLGKVSYELVVEDHVEHAHADLSTCSGRYEVLLASGPW